MAASAVLLPIPQQHQHEPIHRAGDGAGNDHRPRDGEHLHHRPRDEPLRLSQVKHRLLQVLLNQLLVIICCLFCSCMVNFTHSFLIYGFALCCFANYCLGELEMRKLFMRTTAIILMLCVSLELLLTGAHADNRLVMYSPEREAAKSVILPISSESSNEAATNAEESMHSIEVEDSIVNGLSFTDRVEDFHEPVQMSDQSRLAQAFDSHGDLTPPYPSGEGAVLVSLSKLCYINGILTVEGTAAELEPGVHLWLSVFNADGRMLQATDATDIIGENGNFVWSIPFSITEQEDYTVKAFVLDQGFVPKCSCESRTMRYMSNTEFLGALEHVDDLVVNTTSSSYSNTDVLLGTATIVDVEAINSQSLQVDWETVPGADYYLIWRKNCRTGRGAFLNRTFDGEESSYLDTGLEPVTRYVYIVFAYAWNEEPSAIYISLSSSAFSGETGEEVFADLAAPSITEIDIRSATSLSIQWSAVDNAEGFIVYRADSQDGAYVEIARYEYLSQNHIDGDLTTNQPYYYKLQAFAYSDAGRFYTGEMSTMMSGTPCLDNPMTGGPAITSVEALDCTHVKILWTGVDGADGYYLYRKKTSTGEIYSIRIPSRNTLSYVDAGLSAGTAYSYTIQAYADALVTDATYYTEESGPLSATTVAEEVIVLSKPDIDNITALSGNTSVSIEWTSVPNAIGYYLLRQTSSSSTYEIVQTINGQTSAIDTKLIPGTKYYYRIQAYAVGSAGTVYTSDRSSAFAVTLPIAAPTIYVIASGPNSITITWNEISNAQDYLVYRSYSKNSDFNKIAETQDSFYVDSSVEVGVQAFYKVKARAANGVTSAFSNRDSDYIDPDDYAEEIDAPDVLSVTTLSSTSLKVRWQTIDNAVKYYVYRSSLGASRGFEQVGETSDRTFTDTGLAPNTKYWYRIRAKSQSGTESVLGLTDCGTTSTGSGGGEPGDPEVLVTSVNVSPDTLELEIGESRLLYADVRPSNASDSDVMWASNNTTVATVNSNGKVTAVGNGAAIITATARDGSGKTDSCLVTVSSAAVPVVAVPSVVGYSIDPSVVVEGDSFSLKGLLCGNGATIVKVTIAAFPVGQHSLQGVHVFTDTVSAETYDLGNVPAILTDHLYTDADGRSMSLDAGNSYDIVIYASLSNGEYFRDGANPSAVVTVTASEEEPFVRVYGVDNADLNGKTLSFAYNAFSGKTIYVLTNIDIMPSSSNESNVNLRIRSYSYTSEGTLYEFAVNGTENPYAYARTVTFKFYENGKVGETVYASFKVKQTGNPKVPIINSIYITDGENWYNNSNDIGIIPNDYDNNKEYRLMVSIKNEVNDDLCWYLYLDNSNVKLERSGGGYFSITPLGNSGNTRVYVSHICAASMDTIDPEFLHYVCSIKMLPKRDYRVIIISQAMWVDEWFEYFVPGSLDPGVNNMSMVEEVFAGCDFNGQKVRISQIYDLQCSKDATDYLLANRGIDESDVTFIYITTHGSKSGLVFGNDSLKYSKLAETIVRIPGIKVLFVDACHSGAIIPKIQENDDGNTYVFTACATSEIAGLDLMPIEGHNWYTSVIHEGFLGNHDMDADKDHKITAQELMNYTTLRLGYRQTPQGSGPNAEFVVFSY